MVNSKDKGKRGERQAAAVIRETLGVEARRGVQYSGSTDSPDVVTDLDNVHFEVKAVEKLNFYSALEQSIRDSGNKIPTVLSKRNRGDWLLTLRFEDLPRLVRELSKVVPMHTKTKK